MVDRDCLQEGKMIYKEPFELFEKWYNEVKARKDILKPNMMCLATIAKGSYPTARIVTLKEYDKDGFIFFTDYESRKAEDIEDNPNVAATFYWEFFDRSVRIEGKAERLSSKENEKHFNSMPVNYQVILCSSRQSQRIISFSEMYERKKVLEDKYVKSGSKLPVSDHWGGYVIYPKEIEFYQGQKDGFHHRVCFRKLEEDETADGKLLHEGKDGWAYERLAP